MPILCRAAQKDKEKEQEQQKEEEGKASDEGGLPCINDNTSGSHCHEQWDTLAFCQHSAPLPDSCPVEMWNSVTSNEVRRLQRGMQ